MRRLRSTLFAGALLAWPAPLLACGGFFPQERIEGTGSVFSADIRLLYLQQDEQTTAVVRSAFEGNAPDFVWVLPLPAPLAQTAEGARLGVVDPGAVDELIFHSDPRFEHHLGCHGWQLYGCAADGGVDTGRASVNVLGIYQAGPYEIVQFATDKEGSVTQRLQEMGFAVPSEAEELLDLYSQGDWPGIFLLVTISQAPITSEPMSLPALAFTYLSDRVIAPLRITSQSAEDEVETLVLSLAAHRMQPDPDPWTTAYLGEHVFGEEFSRYYDARLRTAIDELDERAWGLEYARELGQGDYLSIFPELAEAGLIDSEEPPTDLFLTRYRSFLSPAWMDKDLELVQADSDDPYAVRLVEGVSEAGLPAGAALLALLGGWGWAARRRRGRDGG